jgi:hypothetical protein
VVMGDMTILFLRCMDPMDIGASRFGNRLFIGDSQPEGVALGKL